MRIKTLYAGLTLAVLLVPASLLSSGAPAYAATIALEPPSGPVGTPILVTGDSFNGRLATISWDGQPLAENVPVNETGKLAYTISVPYAARGDHIIEVSDDTHWSGSSASVAFTVLPKITIFPTLSRVPTEIMVSGSGFAAFESSIRVTWDGEITKNSPATADKIGRWNAVVETGDAARGDHYIGAFGSVTTASESGKVVFVAGPLAKIHPSSGPAGTVLTVSGVGFRIGEDGITITYDGEIIQCNITGGPEGKWSTTIEIPPSTRGSHTIGVYGSSFTPKGKVPDNAFQVTPLIQLDPVSGTKGTTVTIAGTGFAADETVLSFTFDETAIGVTAEADAGGSFSAKFDVPQSKGNQHTVTATGNGGSSAKANFATTKAPPAKPQLISPEQDARLEIFGSVADVFVGSFKYLGGLSDFLRGSGPLPLRPTSVILDWSEEDGQTDVSYTVQISQANRAGSFSEPAFSKGNLASSNYTLSEREILASGAYIWRVQAGDSVGNESPWSDTGQFEIVSISTKNLILSLALLTAILALIVFAIWMLMANRLQR